MSGVMLKTADLRPAARLLRPAARADRGGGACCCSRSASPRALFGVVFAAVQIDMKRLLAYSSIENIGLLFVGIGLAVLFSRLRHAADGGAGADRGALSRRQPRVLQEPAVPRHRRRAARHRRAQPRQARRPDPLHALGRLADAGRRAGQRRPAAARRLRLRMAAAAELPVHAGPARAVPQHADPGRRRADRAGRRARRLHDGQVLRRHLPRPAARGEACARRSDAGPWERVGMVWLALGCVALGPVAGRSSSS